MTDLELLELAAKAAGLPPDGYDGGPGGPMSKGGLVWSGSGRCIDWNPLKDKVDALDLALKLRMSIVITSTGPSARAEDRIQWADERISAGEDCGAALCRAVVRAAADVAPAAVDQRTVDTPL
jgi:hypothetical protein